ncbi:Moderate conductance mechanosensitive channel YbiO precursor [Falsiruegeria litorea R37]|uniref:Moderate conductance mechanosensitive channel YbiO n=1 Tax=Falsiruegeria litorea R37 TaxID=1200284 RepID=A0A1Y5SQD7_9RHOB|nr:mechanosensitive ion channel family protein [Falsiruegeria litorea]SLN42896.1 Moderate conductance mechanosensitive channel YbiO precursor [Falsiruegeria litorea R37]
MPRAIFPSIAALFVTLPLPKSAGAQEAAPPPFLVEVDFEGAAQILWTAGVRLQDVVVAMRQSPAAVTDLIRDLGQFGFEPVKALWLCVLFTAIAILAELGIRRMLRPFLSTAAQTTPQSHTQRGLTRLLAEAGAIGCFALVATVPLMMALGRDPVALALLLTLGPAVLAVRVVEAVFRRLAEPFTTDADSRWLDMNDHDAARFYFSFVGLTALSAFFYFSVRLLQQGGLVADVVVGFTLLTRTFLAATLIAAFFANQGGVSALIRKRRSGLDRGPRWQALAGVWHKLASAYVVLSWLWTSVLVLVESPDADRASILSFLVLMGSLIAALSLDGWIYRDEKQEDFELSVFKEVSLRVGGQAVVGASLVLLIYIWLPTWDDLPLLATGSAPREVFVQILVTLFLAHFVWMLFVVSTRRLAGTTVDDPHQPQTRVETLLPLVRTVIFFGLISVTTVIIMSALGVDLLPLFAGASIFGLAIGLGSQTLVRDVISGLFFLFDDAFRVGEYVDLGLAMGTVEKVSTRSMRLRHHLGTVHTIPYGEIKTVANLSRDWVIYPVEFRVPFDVDPNDLRKKIKALGKKLAQNPDYGHKFTAPLKCQGIVGMEDATMMVRCKFMTNPGDQFELRRIVYDELRELMRNEGISLAAREVRVSSGGKDPKQAAASTAVDFGGSDPL